ncbi:hypothetical protein CTZ27_38190 [Streptomyces griseocarneus]|nr:hypothetical protein CTZ27_38190 [Streptomyces griseocarneus]
MSCPHAGTPVGFVGEYGGTPVAGNSGRAVVELLLSCGCRTPAVSGCRLSLFADRPEGTLTWCDPAGGTVGRQALAQVPVFYTQLPDAHVSDARPSGTGRVRFATRLAEALPPGARPNTVAVAAMLLGRPLPAPLTPWEGVYQLPAGSELTCTSAGIRIRLHPIDLAYLPGGPLRPALIQALAALPGDRLAVSGGAASLTLAHLAATAGLPLTAVHAAVGLPVLQRRSQRLRQLLPGCHLLDTRVAWDRLPALPGDDDPWAAAAGAAGDALPASGTGLAAVTSAMSAPCGTAVSRARSGWRTLTADQPPEHLTGQPSWRAWFPPATPRHHPPGDFLSTSAHQAAAGPAAPTHLVPDHADQDTRRRIARIGALLEECAWLPAAPLPVLHPAVIGAALSGTRRRTGPPDGWLDLGPAHTCAVDPPTQIKTRLYASTWVTRHLSDPACQQALLDQAGGSDWVRPGVLAQTLSDPTARLQSAPLLHRLCAVLTAYPDLPTTSPAGTPAADTAAPQATAAAPGRDTLPLAADPHHLPPPPLPQGTRWKTVDGIQLQPLPFGAVLAVDRTHLTAAEIDPHLAGLITGAGLIDTTAAPEPLRRRLATALEQGWLEPAPAPSAQPQEQR